MYIFFKKIICVLRNSSWNDGTSEESDISPSNSEDEPVSDHRRRPRRKVTVISKQKSAKKRNRKKNNSSDDDSESDEENKRFVGEIEILVTIDFKLSFHRIPLDLRRVELLRPLATRKTAKMRKRTPKI